MLRTPQFKFTALKMLFLFKEIETFRIHRWHNTRNYSIKKYKAAL